MKLCTQCHESKSKSEFTETYAICKKCYAKNKSLKRAKDKASADYTSKNIKIMKLSDFDFSHAHDLCHAFQRPLVFVQRGLEACRSAGIDKSFFINRYLIGDKTTQKNPKVEAALRDLLREDKNCSVSIELD